MIKWIFMIILISAGLFAQVNKEADDKSLVEFIRNLPKTPAAVQAIESTLYWGNDKVKDTALEALVSIGTKDTYRIFNRYIGYGLEHRSSTEDKSESLAWQIRAKSAIGLSKTPGEETSARIRDIWVKEDNFMVKKALIFAMGELQDRQSVPLLLDVVSFEKDESLVYSAVVALGKIKDKSTFLPLIKVRTGNYLRTTKIAAQNALNNISWN